MLKKEVQRLENSIVLSIQYSRLTEEIDDTVTKISVIKDKKIALSKTKKIKENEKHIEKVKEAINDTENNFSESRYNLVQKNLLEEKLNLLSKQKDFETIKYNIAIRTVLDNTVEYKNTDDYLENISKIIFNDETKIAKIEKELRQLYGVLTDTKPEVPDVTSPTITPTDAVPAIAAVAPAAKPLLPKLKKAGLIVLEGIKKHPKIAITLAIAGSAVAIGGGVITGFRKRRKTVRAFKHIAPEDLEYVLLANGLCLKTAKEYMDEVEYYKYFQNKMRVINLYKKKIDKELFVKWYEMNDNSKKIMLLNRFDEYLIKHIKFIEK